jgi:hypothetical protein
MNIGQRKLLTGFIINNPTKFELEIKENLTRILKDISHDNL